jgi:hypothetical protein
LRYPSFHPKGTCPRWAESPAARSETKLCTRQFHSTTEGEKKMFGIVTVALAKCLLHFVASLACMLLRDFPLLFLCSFPRFPTLSRSCNGHAPLLIQKGRGQKVQPRQVRQSSALNSSKAVGTWERNVLHTEVHTKFLRGNEMFFTQRFTPSFCVEKKCSSHRGSHQVFAYLHDVFSHSHKDSHFCFFPSP